MREESRAHLALVGKSVLLIVGLLLAVAAIVELSVAGWTPRAAMVLAAGLVMALPPLVFAFRDAVRAAHRGER